ncbi:MAG: Arm DNA-binding domain-containing protein, partial [Alicyclobacillus sp.]|nr:Arm DNA-binding domain-containing protein [Alicyclobacillus sp.]
MRGHIRKRGSKWCIVLFLGYDERGKKRYKWIGGFDTKKAAERAMAEKIREIDTGMFADTERQTTGEYLRQWIEDKSTQLRPGTVKAYRWLLDGHI